MSTALRLRTPLLRYVRPPRPFLFLRHPRNPPLLRRPYAKTLSHPPAAERTFGIPWPFYPPLFLLGMGGAVLFYFKFLYTNEFIEAGFPADAAEKFRVAASTDNDMKYPLATRHWRQGLQILVEQDWNPFDPRVVAITVRLFHTLLKDENFVAQRELLEEIKVEALRQLRRPRPDKEGNEIGRGRLVALAVYASLGLVSVELRTSRDREIIMNEFKWCMNLLQHENQTQRTGPDCPSEHWGWIPSKRDRVRVLRDVALTAYELRLPILSLNYFLEALPVFPVDHPDSLDTMVWIGKLVANPQRDVPFTKEELINQANLWFNKVIQVRESMPRNFPVGSNPPRFVSSRPLVAPTDDHYTPYGWDAVSDRAYISAIWQLGLNQKALGDEKKAQQLFQRAIELSKQYKLDDEHKRLLKEKLAVEGKVEESKNPYYWG